MPEHLLVEARRVGRRAHLDRHARCAGLPSPRSPSLSGALAHQVDHDGVAGLDRAAVDRLESRGALAAAVPAPGRWRRPRRRPAAVRTSIVATVAGIERRHDVERGREGQRLALLDLQVPDVGLSTGSTPRSVSASSHRVPDQVLGGVLQNLPAEPLPHHLRRHLARPEARQARRLAVARGHLVDLRDRPCRRGISTTRFLRVSLTSTSSVFIRVLLELRMILDVGTIAVAGGTAARLPSAHLRGSAASARQSFARASVACRAEALSASDGGGWCERGESNPHSLSATGS